jgi:hypothetical protein
MAFKLLKLLKLCRKITRLLECEWFPDITKEQVQKYHLIQETNQLIDDFVQEFNLGNTI